MKARKVENKTASRKKQNHNFKKINRDYLLVTAWLHFKIGGKTFQLPENLPN
jgi:hypothetical protein